MTYSLRPLDVVDLEQKPLSPPNAEPLSGEILVRSKVEFTDKDRTIISGIWESDPGVSRWEFTTRGEIIHLLQGVMIVEEDGKEPVELTAGTAAYFPLGWKGTWTVVEPVRKFYVVYK